MNTVLNVIGFQLVWMLTVGGAAQGYWWTGIPPLIIFAAWQWRVSSVRRSDALLVVIAAVLGFGIDSAFAASHWLEYQTPTPSPVFAPIWILVLWMSFALTLNHSMRFLHDRTWLGVAFGAIGGPLAYLIADRVWGAVNMAKPGWMVLFALGVAWAVVTPLLVRWAQQLSRQKEQWT